MCSGDREVGEGKKHMVAVVISLKLALDRLVMYLHRMGASGIG